MKTPSRGGRRGLRLAIALFCLAALAWTVARLGPREIGAVVLRADARWLALSLLPLGARFAVWALKWTRMLRRYRPVPFRLALRILGAGSFANLTTPTAKLAGGFVRAALLHRRQGWPLTTAYGYALADQVTNVLGHLLLFGVIAMAAALTLTTSPYRQPLGLAGLATLAALLVLGLLRPVAWRWLRRADFEQRLLRLLPARFRSSGSPDADVERLRRLFAPLLHDGPAGRTFVADLLLAALAFLMICLANALVMRSIGVDAPLLLLSAALALGYFAGIVVGVWGGVGVTEAALTAIYVQLGIPPEQAAAGTLLHRAALYAVVLVWGGYALAREGGRSVTAGAGVDHPGGS